MAKVLVTDSVDQKAIDVLTACKEIEVVVDHKISAEDLEKRMGEFEAIVIRSRTKMTPAIIKAGKNLKIIARAGVGVDNVDLETASNQGVIVVNSPEGNTVAAAEHTLALMMSLTRQVPDAHISMKAGKWDRAKFMGSEVYKKKLGLIGFGKIGAWVAKASYAMGMQIMVYDPFVSKDVVEKLDYQYVPNLDELFKNADYITLHIPKTKDTANIISAENIARMKKGVKIINCARGGLIDEKALADALVSGQVGGAALDVFNSEPPEANNPLANAPNIILTPHLGASTEEAQVNVAIDVSEQIVDVLTGGMARSAVNIPSMKPEIMGQIKQYMPLAERLGALVSQVISGGIKEVNVNYMGTVAGKPLAPLSTAVIKGLLTPTMKERVNFVNASLIAKERAIELKESKSDDAHDYTDLIQVEIVTDKDKHTVTGTLMDGKEPRIVSIDKYKINIAPTGNLLLIYHHDEPGIIGKLGTMLGNNKINIAAMQVGREQVGGQALMVVNIDTPCSDELLSQIEKEKGFAKVKQVQL